MADIVASITLCDFLLNGDELIDQLVGQGCWTAIVSSIWEGLESGWWSDAELDTIGRAAFSQAYIDIPIETLYGEIEFALEQ